MKVTEIRVERKFNMGNYESLGISIAVDPPPSLEGEDWNKTCDAVSMRLDAKVRELRKRLG